MDGGSKDGRSVAFSAKRIAVNATSRRAQPNLTNPSHSTMFLALITCQPSILVAQERNDGWQVFHHDGTCRFTLLAYRNPLSRLFRAPVRLLSDMDKFTELLVQSALHCNCRPLANRSEVEPCQRYVQAVFVQKSLTDVVWRRRQLKRRKCMVQQADPRPCTQLRTTPLGPRVVNIGPLFPRCEEFWFCHAWA
jgi:hypothetical protein